ncbi:hypothetical protein [Amycolatopsis sp. NPDC050768]|uniref:hypothetical protein n=1 Tax=unclassified Amycolatopsis TaxID=2618356 RepID=UPI003410926C
MGPEALRVTGELADGTLPYLAAPRVLGEHIVPAITKAADEAGRPAPRIVAFVAGTVTGERRGSPGESVAGHGFLRSGPLLPAGGVAGRRAARG